MIENKEINRTFEKYPEYKDSGVEWLGEIPEGWELKRFKYIAGTQKGKLPKYIVSENLNNEPPYMSMEYLRGGEENQWVLDKDVIVVDENETLLLWDGSNAGEFIKSRKGVISSTVAHISFKNINNRYAWYFSKKLEIELRKRTIGMGIPHVNGGFLNNSLVTIPSVQEQTAIATFLDNKTSKIDTAIAQKEQMIALLKERKQIIIQNAVTGKWSMVNGEWSMTPREKMKDSGVEWIGEIPEGWEVKKVKYCLKSISEKVISKDSEFSYIGMENIESKTGKRIESENESEGLSNKFNEGDILFGKLRPYLAKVFLADIEGICSTEFIVYRTQHPQYFHKLLLSDAFINLVDSSTYGAKMPRANADWIGEQLIPIPQEYEQKEISNYIELRADKIDRAISLQQSQIEKLKEYKATLIDSAVTGKIKVTGE